MSSAVFDEMAAARSEDGPAFLLVERIYGAHVASARQDRSQYRALRIGNPHRLADAISPHTLIAGIVIAASLITGLNSDLPGLGNRAGDREHLR